MPKTADKLMTPRALYDQPTVEPTIQKGRTKLVPQRNGGCPKPHEHDKIDAMSAEYKC